MFKMWDKYRKLNLVQIQTTSICNARCICCPYKNSWYLKNPGYMSDKIYTKILEDTNDYDPEFTGKFAPYLCNEPFSDKNILKRAELAYNKLHNPYVEFSSNMGLLNKKKIDELYEFYKRHEFYGKFTISHHGVNKETFESFMNIPYEKSLDNMIYLLKKFDGQLRISIQNMAFSLDRKFQMNPTRMVTRYLDRIIDSNNINRENLITDPKIFHNRAGNVKIKGWNYDKIIRADLRGFDCLRLHGCLHVIYTGEIIGCCIPPGEKILMSDKTYKNIEDIRVGDIVYTHTGETHKVTETFERYVDEDLISLKTSNYYKDIILTSNHPILIKERNSGNIVWKNVGDINRLDYMILPKLKSGNMHGLMTTNYNRDDISDLGDNLLYSSNRQNNKVISDNYIEKYIDLRNEPFSELMWVFGMYLAEGFTTKDEREVVFCLNKDEKDKAKKIIDILEHICTFKYNIKEYRDNNYDLHIVNKPLSVMFNKLFGKYRNKKYIHKDIMKLNYKLLRKLIDGFIDGDGYRENRRYRLIITSEILTKQLYIILASIDNLPSISKIVRENKLPYYEICISKYKNKMVHSDKNNIYIPICKIENFNYKGLVYNIEVEKDSSYIYDIYSVHNCMDYFRETILGDLRSTTVNEFFNSDNWKNWVNKVRGVVETPDDFICKRCMSPGG